MPRAHRLDDQIGRLREAVPLRAKSLIVTIYGDSILPHGGSTWLGSLIRLVAPLGLSERMVRTAVFRLTRDAWLRPQPVGRRSYYSLTTEGLRRFERAHQRIYAIDQPPWDGGWLLVFTNAMPLDPDAREALRRDLLWQGFGNVAPSVLAHPGVAEDSLRQTLDAHGVADRVVVLRGEGHPLTDPAARVALVKSCWDLNTLGADYGRFLDRFRPVWRALEVVGSACTPEQAFLVRTLLIHDYRRVLLRDPLLPVEVLPPDWPGLAARRLCRSIYRATGALAEQHIMARLDTVDGPLPPASALFHARFGGVMEEVSAP
ncbi:phenylacetic acid degradation operon negative regulatory protein PaaX [Roseospira marina]|uniref:Phenylacetic acid degradation operon negative regulatory protein PaaX n=1 Tax=Roseospira marina TaxID=140057 RepID=A0A5M6IDQ4_9PROT|nr:phenylacetic acid degradation operon negative regulatory protein PaaX [Roseospira marina]KAA5605728.1 phenylacetic acid degradation operon negative regulatory protein PaaX [Roseospira marina]MBB4313529.1 phenylacetic acid degradation operon negative regulatory protein [Roseospira marina]MBB5086691.1 phenylacetic acid degradation operon negative regulatory protein [Roseospira marina]